MWREHFIINHSCTSHLLAKQTLRKDTLIYHLPFFDSLISLHHENEIHRKMNRSNEEEHSSPEATREKNIHGTMVELFFWLCLQSLMGQSN